jgi:hypothetical protein
MIAVFLAGVLLAQASPGASPACHAGDISITDLKGKTVKGSPRLGTDDRLLLTADFTNVGGAAQEPHTPQHAEVLHEGAVLASLPLPALGAGVKYPMTFRIFRAKADAKNQFAVTVRYVLDDAQRARNNCSGGNDSIQKTF